MDEMEMKLRVKRPGALFTKPVILVGLIRSAKNKIKILLKEMNVELTVIPGNRVSQFDYTSWMSVSINNFKIVQGEWNKRMENQIVMLQ